MLISPSVYISPHIINLSRYFLADNTCSGSPYLMMNEPKLKIIVQEPQHAGIGHGQKDLSFLQNTCQCGLLVHFFIFFLSGTFCMCCGAPL